MTDHNSCSNDSRLDEQIVVKALIVPDKESTVKKKTADGT